MRYAFLLLLSCVVLNGNRLQAQDYLLWMQPVRGANDQTNEAIEFHIVEGRPFFVRSTLEGRSQFLARGVLRKLTNTSFEIEYSCQISELRADPPLRLSREGKMKIQLFGADELASKLSAEEQTNRSGFDIRVALKPLNPEFGARHSSSKWAVRLVDADGKPVAQARGGLCMPLDSGEGFDYVVQTRSGDDGVMTFSEGREAIPIMTFYAEHSGKKLFAAAYLNADEMHAKNHEYFTVTMRDAPVPWLKLDKLHSDPSP